MRGLLLTLALLAGGCVTTALPPAARGAIEKELRESPPERYLVVSVYVTPFFGDASKKLLTPVPPDEVSLLNQPSGAPVSPGEIEKILPAGTKMRLLKVEFPTMWVLTERIPYTPRHLPWIYLQLATESENALPYIIPLPPDVDSQPRFIAEMERYLSVHDPAKVITAWPEVVRVAIRTKTAVQDMPVEALTMSLGYPERIVTRFEGAIRREEWIYPGGKRLAIVADGKLVRLESPPGKPVELPPMTE